MTGIERLRELADTLRENIGDMQLNSSSEPLWRIIINIADQIEREHRERNGALEEENERLRDMLNEVAWGLGLGDSAHYYSDDNYQACQDAVHAAIDRRLLPEGMEWPRFEDGEPVRIGDEVTVIVHDEDGDFDRTLEIRSIKYKQDGVLLEGTKNEMVMISHGERVRRSAKVLDADGAEIRVGDTVWHVHDLDKFTVTNSNNGENLSVTCMGEDGKEYCCYPNGLTHRAPSSRRTAGRCARGRRCGTLTVVGHTRLRGSSESRCASCSEVASTTKCRATHRSSSTSDPTA